MDVELKQASEGLPAYANARSGTLVVTGICQAIRGVGQRYFSERWPHLRIATDNGRPAAHLRQLVWHRFAGTR
jgi:hypothetical protein